MNTFLRCLVMLLFSSTIVLAQDVSLSGVITDAETGEPLVGASVVTEEGKGVTTDLDGKYVLKLAKKLHKVKYSFIGYEAKVKEIDLSSGAPVIKNVKLGMMSEQLDIVVVSASQYEKSIAEETVSMEVLGKELIKNNNSTELTEAVRKTPGVLVQDNQISIRGGSSYSYGVGSRTAVMVDGVSFMSADLGEGQMRGVPMESIEQIEVIKGSSSVVYGSSALNGVVNVRTAWPKEATPKTSFTTFLTVYDNPPEPTDSLRWWSTNDTRTNMGMSFNHARKVKGTDVIVGGNFINHRSYLENADELRGGLLFKTRFHPKSKKGMTYGFNANFTAEKSGRFFLAVNPNDHALESFQPSHDQYVRFNLDPHFNSLDERGNKHMIESRYMLITRIPGPNSTTKQAISNQVTVNYQYQKRWGKKWVLTTGLPTNLGFSVSNLYPESRITYSGAIYAQGEFKTDRLSAVAGLRYEILGVSAFLETGLPVFRAGLNYRLGKATFLRASFGQSYRLPTVAELYLDDNLNDAVTVIPNPTLESEKGMGAEIGAKQVFKFDKWFAYADLTFFYQQYKNYVEYNLILNGFEPYDSLFVGPLDSFVVGMHPQNVSDALICGLEATLVSKGQIGPVGVNILLGYTYNYPMNLDSAKSIGAGQYLSEFFEFMGRRTDEYASQRLLQFRSRHQVTGDLQLDYKRFGIGMSVFYGSFPEYYPGVAVDAVNLISSNDGSGLPPFESYASRHQKGDLIFDVRASYQLAKFLKATFIVKNVGNKMYALRPSKAEPIRNYTLQLRFNF